MSVKYWEYQGTPELLWETHQIYKDRYARSKSIPIPDFDHTNTLELFKDPEITTKFLYTHDHSWHAYKGHDSRRLMDTLRFFTYVNFFRDYQNTPDHFKHLSIDYSQGDFNFHVGRTRIRFMYPINHCIAKAWIRSENYQLPKEIQHCVKEVSLDDIKSKDYSINPNDSNNNTWTATPTDKFDFDHTRFEIGSNLIKNFMESNSLKFSRNEINQELSELPISDNPDWYIDFHSDLPTSEYHSRNITTIALASVFAGRQTSVPLFTVSKT